MFRCCDNSIDKEEYKCSANIIVMFSISNLLIRCITNRFTYTHCCGRNSH